MTTHFQLNIANLEDMCKALFTCLKPYLDTYYSSFSLEDSNKKEFLSVKETKALLNKSTPTLDKLARQGVLKKHKLPGLRGIFYNRNEIMKLLNKSALN